MDKKILSKISGRNGAVLFAKIAVFLLIIILILEFGDYQLEVVTLSFLCVLLFVAEIIASVKKNIALEQLRDSKSYLKNIVDNVADPIFVKDRQHRWIDGNIAFWHLMNRKPEEVIGKSDYDFFPQDEVDVFWEKDEEVFNTGKININVENLTDIYGNTHTLSTKKAGFVLANGEPVLVGIIRDITELRRTQDKLKESDEARLKSIMDHSGRPVYIKDLEGRYLQVNRFFTAHRGLKEEEIIGKTDYDLFPQTAESWRKNDLEVVRRNTAIEFEEVATDDMGVKHIYTSVKFPIYDANGDIYATCGISTEITERKKDEETIRKVMMELKRANAELERFAYICSHDLQEPLRTINSFAQLLKKHLEEGMDAKTAKYLSFIVEGSTRARELIIDVLEYSRLDYEIEKHTEVKVAEVVSAIIDNLEANLKETEARITYENMPVILANKTLFGQLLQNLIHNAIKFCDKKIPEIHIEAKATDDGWLFSVSDNGIGISEEYQDKIFEVFQRLHGRAEYPGTGIGLAICKKIVERHGGHIWVDSKKGEGSIFFFTISKNYQPRKDEEITGQA